MAPEYLADGLFSFKSDVFSFGVLVLEILSGKRNKVLNQTDMSSNLLVQVINFNTCDFILHGSSNILLV